MLKSRLVREQDAKLYFEVMAWLIQNYGAPPRPPVPSPLFKSHGLEKLTWNALDSRCICDWANDHFALIKDQCHMGSWDLELVPAGDDLNTTQLAATRRLDALAAGLNPYILEKREPVFYDPRDCVEPGYFTAQVILQLAEKQVTNFKSEFGLSPLMQGMVTLTSATYCRQGFTLANLPENVSRFLTSQNDLRAVPQRIVQNALCFTTCLGLRIRRQTTEQIIATYGTRMPNSFRRKVRLACKQIDGHVEELAVLQMRADPRPKRMGRVDKVVLRA